MRIDFLLCALLLAGCNLLQVDEGRYLPDGRNTALLRNHSYVSHDAGSIVFDMSVSVISEYGQYDLDFYLKEEFHFEGDGTFQIQEFEHGSVIKTGNSSTILLIDQSGSYLENDPTNNRSKAMNKFLEDFSSPDAFLVGGFADGGLVTSPAEYSRKNFISEWTDREFLFGLAARTGGTNALRNAIEDALDKLAPVTTSRKEIVVLQHTAAGEELASFGNVVNKANSNNVKLHILYLGAVPLPEEVWELPNQTGGLLAVCPVDEDLTTVFNHLHRLLNKSSSVYNLRIGFNPTGGNIVSGNEYELMLKIKDKFDDFEFNPVYVKIKIP